MTINLSELRRIYEPDSSGPHNGACSRLVNEFVGEPLFLALLAECLTLNTHSEWTFHVGEARGLIENNKRSTSKRLDGFVRGVDPGGRIPQLIACEVKGWSDNSLGGYKLTTSTSAEKTPKPPRGEFYWHGLPAGFDRGQVTGREGVFCKLDAEWNPPGDHTGADKCAVALVMYHLMEPPAATVGIEWPLGNTKSIFWFHPPEFTVQTRVLVFSVAKYLEERSSEEFELRDSMTDRKVEALRRLGVM